MISLVFSVLLSGIALIAVGAIALVRAGGAPSGKGLILTSGALFVLLGLASIGWTVYLRFFAFPMLDLDAVAPPGLMPPWVASTYTLVTRLGLLIAIVLLVFGVLSARGKQAAAQGAPVPGGPQGYGPQPGRAPGQAPYAQQGAPQQQYPGAQQPQQPPQGHPTGPQNPYQQPPQPPSGPQQPPQQPGPGGRQRPEQPPQGGPSGPQEPPQG
ncbi:hypothetical protein [Nocardiopsis aegyptia]|uniref:Uncharacterized protein n=1 Tax=Nocardiopsis aegyptia TaxID=220378 RepID=A0A7Z0JBQ7_9ACTN|nr:hypothetical protein [Nocardiopsis aegyptia]NYJ35674.1 hypothetical protein [Nocardiopsis aegyptia]